ncbi:bone morphogenetic protein 6 isoform X1 [Oncorhynchus kisutch]|uniref:bone morphogenetic protein 6 isoform X1 n=1 Tax=Oncorhynchus kisutch TaxID=8019 RepID=UPI0009A08CF2|nr:bone morphogenetic protein 6 isoform X1 [Oncorhynchus kisutch]
MSICLQRKMIILRYLMVMLSSWPLGETFILKSSGQKPKATPTDFAPVITLNSCQGEPLSDIKHFLLRGLNLQREPQTKGTGLASLREQWMAAFTTQRSDSQTALDSNAGNSQQEFSGNTTGPHCCQLVSKIYIQDLGWQNWIIYPERFTFTQCAACTTQLNPAGQQCGAHLPSQDSPPEVSCCKPASQHLVPVLYLDEFNTLIISSVYLTRDCSCTPAINPHRHT